MNCAFTEESVVRVPAGVVHAVLPEDTFLTCNFFTNSVGARLLEPPLSSRALRVIGFGLLIHVLN